MIPTTSPITCRGKEVSFQINKSLKHFNIDNGTDIDNWSLEDLIQMVQEYYVYCGGDQ